MYTAKDYHMATSLQDAMSLLKEGKDNAIIAGGMMMRLGKQDYRTLIDLSKLGLDYVKESNGFLSIGAMTSLRTVETDPLIRAHADGVLSKSVSYIIGTQFRSGATLGASVYGRFAFSDPITALLALDAEVRFYESGRMRLATYLTGLPRRDILISVDIPLDGRRASYQTHRLTSTDFGVLDLCIAKKTNGEYRVSVGSRPAVAARARNAENLLADGKIEEALQTIPSELTYGANMRSSAEYRRVLARVLSKRALDELSETEAAK